MRNFFLFFVFVVVLGCENLEQSLITEPDELRLTEISNSTFEIDLHTSLSLDQRQTLIAGLERSGYRVTSEDLEVLLRVVEKTLQTIQSTEHEMPLSLKQSTGSWEEIAKNDPVAAAFLQKLENEIDKNLTAIDIPHQLSPCWEQVPIYSMAVCFNDFKLVCKYFGLDTCLSVGHISELLHCLLWGCHTSFPH